MTDQLHSTLENGWQALLRINRGMSSDLSTTGSCPGYARMRGHYGDVGHLVDGSTLHLSTEYAVSAQFFREEEGGGLAQFRCHMIADETLGRVCRCVHDDDSPFVPTPCPVLQRILDARGGRAR